MPPIVIDLRSAEDSRDVVHRAVQALAEGKVVAFPTETVYALAASALVERAVERLARIGRTGDAWPGSQGLMLAVKSADDALDYVPNLGLLGERLARRCWPGPLALIVEDRHPDSLSRQLSPAVQQLLSPSGEIVLRVPAHSAIHDVQRLLAGPLVFSGIQRHVHPGAVTAQQVVEAMRDEVHLVLDDGRSRYGQPVSVVRVRRRDFELIEVGVVSEQTLKRLASLIVLFVCTGNTCRSPMAEGMFRQLVAQRLGCKPEQVEDRGVVVLSAGIAAMTGGRAAGEAIEVLRSMQIDLSTHESQPLSEQLVRHADLILAMTRSHRQAVLADWPAAAERLKLVCHDGSDVPDPVGGSVEQYRRCVAQLKPELERWAAELEL
ncbi:MAG TPA: Sua5/YciO/YrdC/YwlC family protein [Pirellulales bacterium]|nr:Sua5/YciO/YrdC/YwlC family protein [Pirellulales bacterium]